MKQLLERILRDYGAAVRLVHEGGSTETVRAFLQPVTAKGWRNMRRIVESVGEIPAGQYLYVGPAVPELQEDDVVEQDGRRYLPRRVELLSLGDERLYCWALLTGCGEDSTWTS